MWLPEDMTEHIARDDGDGRLSDPIWRAGMRRDGLLNGEMPRTRGNLLKTIIKEVIASRNLLIIPSHHLNNNNNHHHN
jgi:hypothetical protein